MTLKNGRDEQRKLLRNCGFLQIPNRAERKSYLELEVDRITPESVLDPPVLLSGSTSIGTTSSGDGVSTGESCRTVVVTKKKRSNVNYGPRILNRQVRCSPAEDVAVAGNRRKGVPQRSHLY